MLFVAEGNYGKWGKLTRHIVLFIAPFAEEAKRITESRFITTNVDYIIKL